MSGLESFRRYSRSKSKVVKNRAEFWTLNFKPNFKLSRSKVFFGGTPSIPFGCALSRLDQSLARIKIWGGSTEPKCSLPRDIHLGGSMLANKTFLFVDQSSITGLFSCNAGGITVDYISFRFWISGAILKIFAIKVESCQQSRWIFHVFRPPKF